MGFVSKEPLCQNVLWRTTIISQQDSRIAWVEHNQIQWWFASILTYWKSDVGWQTTEQSYHGQESKIQSWKRWWGLEESLDEVVFQVLFGVRSGPKQGHRSMGWVLLHWMAPTVFTGEGFSIIQYPKPKINKSWKLHREHRTHKGFDMIVFGGHASCNVPSAHL